MTGDLRVQNEHPEPTLTKVRLSFMNGLDWQYPRCQKCQIGLSGSKADASNTPSWLSRGKFDDGQLGTLLRHLPPQLQVLRALAGHRSCKPSLGASKFELVDHLAVHI